MMRGCSCEKDASCVDLCEARRGPVSTWRLVTKPTGGGCIKCFTYKKQPYYLSLSLSLFFSSSSPFSLFPTCRLMMRCVQSPHHLKRHTKNNKNKMKSQPDTFEMTHGLFKASELNKKSAEKSNWNRKEEWQGWNHLDKFVQRKSEWVRERGRNRKREKKKNRERQERKE